MKADDLTLAETVEFADGAINLHGRRLVLQSIHARAQSRKDLIGMVGLHQARRIQTRFGYFWGNADAAAMKRVFTWDSLEDLLRAGPRMLELQGVVKTQLKTLSVDAGNFHMQLVWRHSGEAEEHRIEFGQATYPVCWMLVGYMSGYASFCTGRNIYFIEESCTGKGDRICTAEGKDEAAWGQALRTHLSYFEAEDIQGKVRTLTVELRRKTRELEAQRKKLTQLADAAAPPFVEVRSECFARVLDVAVRAARFDSSVVITGETGVGKEVLARHIHRLSPRASGPFVAVNCGALPETLLESELFGHKAGAFTGAIRDRTGLFEEAQKGTVFLDEVGEISPAMQRKLLRVIQEREIMRLGESRTRSVDVRIIAATNIDLVAAVKQGTFREDLYYRLGVIEIHVPPLRERPEDILPLVRHFVRMLAERPGMHKLRMEGTCVDYLHAYAWPGNIRELQNSIERAAVLCKDRVIRPEDLPSHIVHAPRRDAPGGGAAGASLKSMEEEHIRAVLERTNGNRSKAAKLLGISTATLWRRLRRMEP